jgi:flagella basal body P-ring formation protein FlgA
MTSLFALSHPGSPHKRTARNSILIAAVALCVAAFIDAAHAAQPVELKRDLEASGAAITLGDLFTDAGSVSARAVAPAPRPGQSTVVSSRFVVAAAAAAGLQWTPPSGLDSLTVSRRDASGALPAPASAQLASAKMLGAGGPSDANATIKRGDLVTLVYIAPGLQLTTRAKALSDGIAGGPIRLVNLQSNRTVDAVVTGPGAASANTGF